MKTEAKSDIFIWNSWKFMVNMTDSYNMLKKTI